LNSAGNATFANVSITSALNVGGVATFTANPVLSGGTANGVLYLNGSKVATSGSAFAFNGTDLTLPAEGYRASATSFLRLSGGDGAGSGANLIVFGQSHATAPGRVSVNAVGTGHTEFSTGGAERMRLTAAGDLGIGTSSPGTILDLGTSTGQKISVYRNANIRYGFGIETDTMRYYVPTGASNAVHSFGQISTTDGTTYTERMRLDASGNLGLGVTPSAWSVVGPALQVLNATFYGYANQARITANAYFNGSDFKYIASAAACEYRQTGGQHQWFNAASGTAGNTITFTQAMTLDASGNLGIGTSSPAQRLDVTGAANSVQARFGNVAGRGLTIGTAVVSGTNDAGVIFNAPTTEGTLIFQTNSTERARITSGGDLLVGTTSGSSHVIKKAVSVGSAVLEVIGNNVGAVFYNGDGGTPNAGDAVLKVWSVGATGRSINAAGTINASGADYAEYMEKAGNFAIAKGDVCGISANGKLTNVYADAISFVVKSTNPSYVGNDGWGGNYENDAEGLEAARQKVDRIAFAGQVPVNVLGATPGQYIVPANDNGAIKGVAVSNPSFEQYQAAVGKVIAVEDDGRARIIVKIA
jgi:hypothetical protein